MFRPMFESIEASHGQKAHAPVGQFLRGDIPNSCRERYVFTNSKTVIEGEPLRHVTDLGGYLRGLAHAVVTKYSACANGRVENRGEQLE